MAISRKLLFFFIGFFLVSRLWGLADKPYHHDESIHAVESWKYAEHGTYKFDPMLHGPFLYHVQAAIFKVLPVNNFTGRLSMAAMAMSTAYLGYSLLSFFPLAALIWLGFFAFSPTLAFYHRYLAMDTPMMFLTALLLWSAFRFSDSGKLKFFYTAVAAYALMVCTKLNFIFVSASVITFFALPSARAAIELKRPLRSLRWHWLPGFLLFTLIFCTLYSTFFTNPGGILDALYRRMIPYWIEQNKIQRIKGPFDYYLPMLAIYELPLLFVLSLGVLHAANSTVKRSRITGVTLAAAFLLLWVFQAKWAVLSTIMDQKFHFTEPWHAPLALLEVLAWGMVVTYHLKREEYGPAFFAHWGFTSLLAYSYAGEKVPWLGTHIIFPFSFYAACHLAIRFQTWSKIKKVRMGVLFTVVAIWQGYITIQAAVTHAADPKERLVYTHTSTEVVRLVNRIDRLAKETKEGKELKIQVNGDSAWPLYWYLRNYTRWFYPTLEPDKKPDIVVVDWTGRETKIPLFPGYHEERCKLREWWVPDPKKESLANDIRYYFTRQVYSVTGSQDLVILIRPDLVAKWGESN